VGYLVAELAAALPNTYKAAKAGRNNLNQDFFDDSDGRAAGRRAEVP